MSLVGEPQLAPIISWHWLRSYLSVVSCLFNLVVLRHRYLNKSPRHNLRKLNLKLNPGRVGWGSRQCGLLMVAWLPPTCGALAPCENNKLLKSHMCIHVYVTWLDICTVLHPDVSAHTCLLFGGSYLVMSDVFQIK